MMRCAPAFFILAAFFVAPLAAPLTFAQDKPAAAVTKRFHSGSLRHGSRIQSLVFLPKGAIKEAETVATLAAGGGNDPIHIWNTATGDRVRSIDMPWAQALAWDNKDKSLVAGSVFRSMRVVNPSEPTADQKYDGSPASYKCVCVSPEGKPILFGLLDGQLLLYYVNTKKAVLLPAHKGEVNAVAVAATGKVFASGGSDRTIILWNIGADTLNKSKTLTAPGMVHALAFTPDGKTLVSGGDDRAIRLWDVEAGRIAHTLPAQKDSIAALALSPDGKILVATSYDETASVWDLEKRQKLHTIPIRFGDVDAIAISEDGKQFAVAGGNCGIRLFDVGTGKEHRLNPGPQAPLARIAVAPAADRLAVLTTAGDIHQWSIKSGAPAESWATKTTPGIQQDVYLINHPNEAIYLTGSSSQPNLEIWDAKTAKAQGTITLPPGEQLAAISFSPSGKTLGLGFRSGTIQLLDWPSREPRSRAKAAGPVSALGISGEAPVVAVASAGKIQLFDVPTGGALRHFLARDDIPENQQPGVSEIVFSPDGKTLAVSGLDGVIRLVDWTTGKQLASCEGHSSAAASLAFAPDGRTFATASFDKTLRVWETFTGVPILTLKDHEGPVAAVAFSPDGRTLYSAGADTKVSAWDATGIPGGIPVAKLDAFQLDTLWKELAHTDAKLGQLSTWKLVGGGKDSATFLGGQVYLIDPKKIDQLFRDLDSPLFPVREKATQDLEKYGRWMEGRLETAVQDPPSLEVKRRVERMLALLRATGALTLKQERSRMLRLMQTLEQIGDPAAAKVLEDLARGAAEPELQREAELSLRRLQKRGG